MARFSLAIGLRESNVTGLQWEQIDMQRQCAWIHADQAKADKDIAIPLNTEALAVIRAQIGKHQTNVFTYVDLLPNRIQLPEPIPPINTCHIFCRNH